MLDLVGSFAQGAVYSESLYLFDVVVGVLRLI